MRSATSTDGIRGLAGRLPRGVEIVVGLAIAAVGVFITFRPFTSLSALIVLISVGLIATGIGSIMTGKPVWGWVMGAAWIIAGVGVLVWPDLSTRGLALVVGVSLIVGGVADIAAGIRATRDERFASVVGGLASVVFGVLALAWPDVTVLVVAVVFGARTVVFGVRLAWTAMRGVSPERDAPATRGRLRRVSHAVVAVLGLVLASGLALVSAKLHEGEPVVDAFYDAPDDVPARPGVLVRSEPYTRDVPDGALAWRILYTTTRDEGQPALASGIVVAPAGAATDPLPVIAWAHGTTGIDRTCAPSILDTGLGAGAFYALDDVIGQGWALVATDYIGLGTEGPHPYLIGEGEARSVLDAVRASRQLAQISVSDETVVWGHSQGGHAALFTGQLASRYAPELDLVGVAAGGPVPDLVELFEVNIGTRVGKILIAMALFAWSETFDADLAGVVTPEARPVVGKIAQNCLYGPGQLLGSVPGALILDLTFVTGRPWEDEPWASIIRDNNPGGSATEAPMLIVQSDADTIVDPEVTRTFVQRLCARGATVELIELQGVSHVDTGAEAGPEVLSWITERFEGSAPPETTCG